MLYSISRAQYRPRSSLRPSASTCRRFHRRRLFACYYSRCTTAAETAKHAVTIIRVDEDSQRAGRARTVLDQVRHPPTSPRPSQTDTNCTHSELTEREYHDVADKTMDRLTEYLEETVEALPGDISDYDVEYSVRFVPPILE